MLLTDQIIWGQRNVRCIAKMKARAGGADLRVTGI